MNHLQNKGFTLVELMVVIVIMGVLAAVGVPKLTSAVAKSKASEVAPAATTYIKLQSAYVMERKQIGVWKRIGYSKPKSDNFGYDRGDIKSRTKIEDLGEAGLVGWVATNKVGMGDCKLGNTWKVILQQGGTDSDGSVKLNFETEVSDAACAALAGDWTKVSKETQVAAVPETPKSKFTGNLTGLNNVVDGKHSLAKAIISGRDSREGASSMSYGSYWGNLYEAGTNMTEYGIEGYVFNYDAKAGMKSDLLDGKSFSAAKVITELYDVSGDAGKLNEGEIFKARQSLYYGREQGAIVGLALYGTRDVYVKINKNGDIDSYCYDEACNEKIDMNTGNAEDWITSEQSPLPDPFDLTVENKIASSPFGQFLSNAENSNEVNIVKTATAFKGLKHEGIDGVVVAMDAKDMKTWLNEVEPASAGQDVKAVAQIFSEEPEMGVVYAATLSLYYGNATTGFNIYERRKVYAVMNDSKNWIYFQEKECQNKVVMNTDVYWKASYEKI